MKTTEHHIDKDIFLYDIEPFRSNGIPNKSILFKMLTGVGATSGEIEFARNTIIIVPNVPVIKGKCKKNKDIFGVHENVYVHMIKNYIKSNVPYKKILTTPESFTKVKKAFAELGIDMYQEYFMLFDECEKIIQEVGFRDAITLPLDDFFKFGQKAFVSATPIQPSDPRFEEQGFEIHRIAPTFEYRQQLQLLFTNNVFFTLRDILINNKRNQYFIFFNSTDSIANFIKFAEIENYSKIFCSEKSVKKLVKNGFKGATSNLGRFSTYNFFTSRFFSAVDIDKDTYSGNPSIILVSDLFSAPHSMLDPFSHAIQIQGRFRKPEDDNGFEREVIHISNTNTDLTSKTREEILVYLEASHDIYEKIAALYNFASNDIAREVLIQALERIDYSRYVKPNGERNHDMVDNKIFEEKIKGFYQQRQSLAEAYRQCGYFSFSEEDVRKIHYSFDDSRRNELERLRENGIKSLNRIAEEILVEIFNRYETGEATDFEHMIDCAHMSVEFPEQMAVVNRAGFELAKKHKFIIKKIEEELRTKKSDKDHFAMMNFIREHFIIGKVYNSDLLKSKIKEGMERYGIKPRSSLQNVRKYLLLSDKPERMKNKTEEKGYRVLDFIF